MRVEYTTKDVCAKRITFDIEDGKMYSVKFSGGCPGNLSAISKLIEGADAGTIATILKGNKCGTRGTSCADQLSIAIEEALSEKYIGQHTIQIGEHMG